MHACIRCRFVFNEMLMLWPAGQAPSGDGDGETETDAFERDWEQRRRGGGDQTVLQQEGTIYSQQQKLLIVKATFGMLASLYI